VVLRPGGATSASASVQVRRDAVAFVAPGTYRVRGSLPDAGLVVDSVTSGAVRLIFDGVAVGNDAGPALWVRSAEEVFVELAAGTESRLRDGIRYEVGHAKAERPNAALFSSADLAIGGTGTLVVEGRSEDGIVSRGRLRVESGTLFVTALDDGLRGREGLAIDGGELSVDAGDDALFATRAVVIRGGALRLRSADDAVRSDGEISITGGELTIADCYEGLDAARITIEGGRIAIQARDDAINAAGATRRDRAKARAAGGAGLRRSADRAARGVTIRSGSLFLDSLGDGIDSNFGAEIAGGTILVYGPTTDFDSALDVDRRFTLSGGWLAAGGSAPFADAPTPAGPQPVVEFTFPEPVAAGRTIRLVAPDGGEVASYRSPRPVESLVFSASGLPTEGPLRAEVDGTAIATASPRAAPAD
jgi:Carbohydrate-binding domain-containing protein Cthe_2159